MTKPDIAHQNRRRAASWELGITIRDLGCFLVRLKAMKRLLVCIDDKA